MKWPFQTQRIVGPWAKSVITCGVRSEKKCACVRTVRCYLYTPRRVRGSCHCLDAKLPERKQNWEVRKTTNGIWIQVILTTVETFSLADSFLRLVWAWLWRCRCYRWSHHSLSCHLWECLSCHWWSQDAPPRTSSNWNSTILSVVGLRDPMCYFVLSSSASEYEVHLCLELLVNWQEYLLMIYNLVVDTVVLLVN